MKRRVSPYRAALFLFACLLIPIPAGLRAQVAPAPFMMNFQGRLAKPDGSPVADGAYSVRFSLWDAAADGTETWNQTITDITTRNGVFSVALLGLPMEAFAGDAYLEIQIGEEVPLSPRQRLVSVPFALKANTVPDGAIGTSQLADSSITDAKILSVDWSKITNAPIGGLSLPFTGSGDAAYPDFLFSILNTGAGGGLYGESTAYTGVYGRSTDGIGVLGESTNGSGVYGTAVNASGVTGVSEMFSGVYGYSGANDGGYFTSGGANGVHGESFSQNGNGVFGVCNNGTYAYGVYGISNDGRGVVGLSISGYGGYFLSNGVALVGENSARLSSGSLGTYINTNGVNRGVGVTGVSTQSSLLTPKGYGGYFVGATGVYAKTTNTFSYAVYAESTSDTSYALYGNGLSGGISAWYQSSDARFKRDVKPLSDPLATITALQGVSFLWKQDGEHNRSFSSGRQVGFIAQEVEKVLPELVMTDPSGYKSVAYANLVPVLVEGMKQEHRRVEHLENENAELKARLTTTEARLSAILQRLEQLEKK